MSVLEHHSSSSRHIFPTQKKKLSENQFFFFSYYYYFIYFWNLPRQDGRESAPCVLSNENLKWTELNWNRTTCFEIIISFLSFHINQVTFDLIDFIWFSTIFQSFATYTRQLIRRLSNKNHQKIFFLTKIFQQKQNKKKQPTSQGRPDTHTHTPLIGCAARVPSLNHLLFQLRPAATYMKKKKKKSPFFFSFCFSLFFKLLFI